MKITIIHLLNNFSGSPNVLSVIAKELLERGHQVELLTNRSEGFLSDIKGVRYRYVSYKWNTSRKLVSSFWLVWVQLEIFFRMLLMSNERIYYINNVAPIGALLACTLTGKKHVIHVHENMQKKTLLYKIYKFTYQRFNKKTIFVSRYVQGQAVGVRDSIIAYNGLSSEFMESIKVTPFDSRKTILMLCSLRSHKGIFEFIKIAKRLPSFRFELVVSESAQDVATFFATNILPDNVMLFPSQKNVHPFYQRARVVLNLSRPKEWVETFGLTILEGLSYGIPVIYPNVGGPIEIGEDGVSGFQVNPTDIDVVTDKVKTLFENDDLYASMSQNAMLRSQKFSAAKMASQIEEYISK